MTAREKNAVANFVTIKYIILNYIEKFTREKEYAGTPETGWLG